VQSLWTAEVVEITAKLIAANNARVEADRRAEWQRSGLRDDRHLPLLP